MIKCECVPGSRYLHGNDALIAEGLLDSTLGDAGNLIGLADPIDFGFAQLEDGIDDRSHRHLPRIEFFPLAAHRDQHQQRKPAGARKRQHVDAIAEAARLHQQRGALSAEPGAGSERNPFFFGCENDVVDVHIGAAAVDQARMT